MSISWSYRERLRDLWHWTMQDSNSWLARLAAGDTNAAENLWQHFFARLHAYAETRLRGLPPGLGEADDVAMSVFKSICRMVQRRTLPSVRDPEYLWPFLAVIAARKVSRLVRRARPGRQGRQIRETDLGWLGFDEEEVPVLDKVIGREPSAEFVVAMRDLWAELLDRLDAGGPEGEKLRTIAELWLQGQTVAQMAAAADMPERTTARKLQMIRRLVRDLSGEPPAERGKLSAE